MLILLIAGMKNSGYVLQQNDVRMKFHDNRSSVSRDKGCRKIGEGQRVDAGIVLHHVPLQQMQLHVCIF